MSWYSIIVFLHVVGALGLFAGIGLEQAGLRGLRRASTTAALREWLAVMSVRRRVEAPAGLLLLLTGMYMVATNWGGQPWISLGLLGLVLMALLGILVTGRTVRALVDALPANDGPVPAAVRHRIGGVALRSAASLRAALALGIVFDMTVKPDGPTALLALCAALVMGALVAWRGGHALPLPRPAQKMD